MACSSKGKSQVTTHLGKREKASFAREKSARSQWDKQRGATAKDPGLKVEAGMSSILLFPQTWSKSYCDWLPRGEKITL